MSRKRKRVVYDGVTYDEIEPPQKRLKIDPVPFDFKGLSVECIGQYLEEIQTKIKETFDSIVACCSYRTYNNTVRSMIRVYTDTKTKESSFWIAKSLHPNKEVRDAGAKAEKAMSKFMIQQEQRKDVYRAFLEYQQQNERLSERWVTCG